MPESNNVRLENLRKLFEYRKIDTLAMVKIVRLFVSSLCF